VGYGLYSFDLWLITKIKRCWVAVAWFKALQWYMAFVGHWPTVAAWSGVLRELLLIFCLRLDWAEA
jgi:hypothetical protein